MKMRGSKGLGLSEDEYGAIEYVTCYRSAMCGEIEPAVATKVGAT